MEAHWCRHAWLPMAAVICLLAVPMAVLATAPELDLTHAVILTPGAKVAPVEYKAAVMLKEEVQRRTGIAWQIMPLSPAPKGRPLIYVGSVATLGAAKVPLAAVAPVKAKNGKPAPEGYVVTTTDRVRTQPRIIAAGNDRRGALYGAGRLLREMTMTTGKATVPACLKIASAPKYPYRGVQLGHRDINDTIDAWTMREYEQYVRDLLIFGANAVEMIAGRGPVGQLRAPMKMSSWDQVVEMSKLLDSYDMDVWLYMGFRETDDPEELQQALDDRRTLFSSCKRIDHVFVPTNEGGGTDIQMLVRCLEQLAKVLHEYHPKAGLWISTQGLETEQLEWFYQYLAEKLPASLAGVVYGPWTHDTLKHTREAVPRRYPVRHYPDVCHAVRCQYPVLTWDPAWAAVYDRQPINPRPYQYAHICNLLSRYTDGAVSYSDGTGDDVNKMIWHALLWDPKADVHGLLVQYARLFIGPSVAREVADGLGMLEKNWSGPALTNAQVGATLEHWKRIESRAPALVKSNWRLQQFLLRAYVDAYVQERLKRDTVDLDACYGILRRFLDGPGAEQSADLAAAGAQVRLIPLGDRRATHLYYRIGELGAALPKSIGMQTSERYGASGPDRGAILDTLGRAVTDREWVGEQLRAIPKLVSEAEKKDAIRAIVDWEQAGEGGFYDDLGNGANGKEPHLVPGPGWAKDPGYIESAQDEHSGAQTGRISWRNQAETLYWTPLRLRYTGLDPNATYVLRANYLGRYKATMQLLVNGEKIGEPVVTPAEGTIVEHEIPQRLTAGGVLKAQWDCYAKRGPQLAEAWLIKRE